MLRLSGGLRRRISYITDVEGDFSYFQRFVCISRVVKWEDVGAVAPKNITHPDDNSADNASTVVSPNYARGTSQWAPLQSPLVPRHAEPVSPTTTATISAGTSLPPQSSPHPTAESGVTLTDHTQRPMAAEVKSPRDPNYDHLVDVTRYRLTFQDATSHFVFGGDAFDHGADLTFGHILLDFKRRFPSRVHLLLGNRDVNKMVFHPRVALGVAGLEADVAEKWCFNLPRPSRDAVAAAAMTKHLRYKDYLRQRQQSAGNDTGSTTTSRSPTSNASASPSNENGEEKLIADPVTFLQWALKHKLGCQNVFDHRRQELEELYRLRKSISNRSADFTAAHNGSAQSVSFPSVSRRVVSDEEVANSFFTAAQPGGVYYEYLRLGELTVTLDGVLFVHGGVNGSNAGFVPSLEATSYAEQLTAGEWWLPEVQPVPAGEDNGVDSITETAETPSSCVVSSTAFTQPTASATTATVIPAPKRKSALEWLGALSAFKAAAFQEWISNTGMCGESLRSYVYPRVIAPQSVAVGTVMQVDGPHHICLTAAAYLIESGIHTVCGGHQPIGDTPAVVRQPGGFMIVDADTSYCGRGNAYCTYHNRRGAAVMELVFDSGSGDRSDENNTSLNRNNAESGAVETGLLVHSLVAHGYRADATPFEFDLFDDLRVGRYVGDGWWVRLPPYAAAAGATASAKVHEGLYELHRTQDGFRHEEVRWATAEEIDAMLRQAAASGQAMVEGELAPRYTKAELAEVRVHRLKTKVTRAP